MSKIIKVGLCLLVADAGALFGLGQLELYKTDGNIVYLLFAILGIIHISMSIIFAYILGTTDENEESDERRPAISHD